jgi:hypothetical protein
VTVNYSFQREGQVRILVQEKGQRARRRNSAGTSRKTRGRQVIPPAPAKKARRVREHVPERRTLMHFAIDGGGGFPEAAADPDRATYSRAQKKRGISRLPNLLGAWLADSGRFPRTYGRSGKRAQAPAGECASTRGRKAHVPVSIAGRQRRLATRTNQLQVSAQLATGAIPMAQTYRRRCCEAFRARLRGQADAACTGRAAAVDRSSGGVVGEARERARRCRRGLRAKAFEQAPAKGGRTIDGKAFEWIAADPASVLCARPSSMASTRCC